MSEVMQKEIDDLKKQLAQKDMAFDGLLSQLDAYREVLNEGANTTMNLRTNVIHLKKAHQKLSNECQEEKTKSSSLLSQYEEALKRNTELDSELSTIKNELESLKQTLA
jgi:chromosome segregation ATPase